MSNLNKIGKEGDNEGSEKKKMSPREKTENEWEEKVANMSFKEKLGATAYDFKINEEITKQEEMMAKHKELGRGKDYESDYERQLVSMKEEKDRLGEIPVNYLNDKYEVHVFCFCFQSTYR